MEPTAGTVGAVVGATVAAGVAAGPQLTSIMLSTITIAINVILTFMDHSPSFILF